MNGIKQIDGGTEVAFEITNRLPVFREVYASNQAGTTVVTGVIRQKARLFPLDGAQYKLGHAQKYASGKLRYPLRRSGVGGEPLWLYTERVSPQQHTPRRSYHSVIGNAEYRFLQQHGGRRGFDIWDGPEQRCFVTSDPGGMIRVLQDIPAVLVLLLPWLDNQVSS